MSRSTALRLLAGCCLLSGIAGLLYQVVWSRYFELLLGSTGRAHIFILSLFMGGLALGSRLFGALADRHANPARLYAMLEGGIALCGIAYPFLYGPLEALVTRFRGEGTFGGGVPGILLCTLSLALPTTLMGGTMPALARCFVSDEAEIGRRVSWLYFVNSLGAVAGTLLGGFGLIPAFGLHATVWCAAALNALVAAASLASSQPFSAAMAGAASVGSPVGPSLDSATLRTARIALVVIGLSGVVSFIYEVAWIRLLTLVLGSAAYSFPLMLSAFILGIALGGLLLSRRSSAGGFYGVLGWAEVTLGVTTLLSIAFYDRLPFALNQLRTMLVPIPENYPIFLLLQLLLCLAVMLVPATIMGLTVPAASRAVTRGPSTVGRGVGDTFAWNTAGTIVGAMVGGFVLLPALGIKATIQVGAAANIVLGLVVLATDPARAGTWVRRIAAPAALAAASTLAYLALSPEWDERHFNAAAYRDTERLPSLAAFRERQSLRRVLYYADGKDASVAVMSQGDGTGGEVLLLTINGKVDATSSPDMVTQLLIGHIPMMLHPEADDVLVVGLGAGVTAGAALAGGAQRVDCIELLPEVVEAARFFTRQNEGLHADPRARIIVDDAKSFMRSTERRYDLILNEPSNVWVAGVPQLFTTEHFENAKARLKPGGLYAQWLHAYEIPDASFFDIVRTFEHSFPYWTCFNLSGHDVLFVGSAEPFAPDYARMDTYLRQPSVAGGLAPWGIEGLLPILSTQMVAKTRTPITLLPPGGDRYTTIRPRLEYETARALFLRERAGAIELIDDRDRPPALSPLWITQYRPPTAPAESVFQRYAAALARHGALFEHMLPAWVSLWESAHPASPAARMARLELAINDPSQSPRPDATLGASSSPALLALETRALFANYMIDRSFARLPDAGALRAALGRLEVLAAGERCRVRFLLARLDLDEGRPAEALENLRAAFESLESQPAGLLERPSAAAIRELALEAHLAAGNVAVVRAELGADTPPSGKSGLATLGRDMLLQRAAMIEERSRAATGGR